MQKLYEVNLTGRLPIFIENFLTNRKIRVGAGNTYSPEYVMAEGVPQGCVVSCTPLKISDILPQFQAFFCTKTSGRENMLT